MSDITDQVRERYAATAVSGLSSDHQGVRAVAEAFGYSPEQLASIPAEANMGLSCGNPTAFASLTPGEVVVDLGWSRQQHAVPVALRWLAEGEAGRIVTLIKPHYELKDRGGALPPGGILAPEVASNTAAEVIASLPALGVRVMAETKSPILGGKAKGASCGRRLKSGWRGGRRVSCFRISTSARSICGSRPAAWSWGLISTSTSGSVP